MSWSNLLGLDKTDKIRSVVFDSLRPHGLYSPWDSPGQNTGIGNHSLLQGSFPTQVSNPGLLHCRQILNQLSHKGSPRILEWVAIPFFNGSSWPRDQTRISCASYIAGRFFTCWATGEALEKERGPLESRALAIGWRYGENGWSPALCGRGGSPEDGDPRRPGEGMTSTGREPEAVGMRVPPGQAADKHPGFLSHIRPASLLPRGPPVSLLSFPLPFLLPAPLSPSSFLLWRISSLVFLFMHSLTHSTNIHWELIAFYYVFFGYWE